VLDECHSVRLDHIKPCLATLYKVDEKLKDISVSGKGKLCDKLQTLVWPLKAVNARKFIEGYSPTPEQP
jgi:hypothetical protein